jgi:hypothetical protein
MPDYLFLMHDDTTQPVDITAWNPYFASLSATGCFQGGSAIGGGLCARKSGPAPAITAQLGGFIRVSADSLDHAQTLLAGNPIYEAGGTVEIRELPRTN